MKKKLLTLAIASALMIPCGIGLASCGGGGEGDAKPSSISIYIKDDTENINYFECEWDSLIGNGEAFKQEDIKIIGHYTGEVKKEIPYSACNKTFYTPREETGPQGEVLYDESTTPFNFMINRDTYNMQPNSYRINFEYEGCEQSLLIYINKGERNINSIGTYFAKWSSDYDGRVKQSVQKEGDAYKFDYAYNERKSGDYFVTSFDNGSLEAVKEEEFLYYVVVDNGEYEKVEDKSLFFNTEEYTHLWSTQFDGYFPYNKDGSPLTPGKYLIVPYFHETEHYSDGYANPIKIEIKPSQINLNGLYVSGGDDITYEQASLILSEDGNGSVSCDLSCGFDLQSVIDDGQTDPANYAAIMTFSNGVWTKTLYKDIKNQKMKLQAYQDDGKYYLADYDIASGKWFKYGTETEIDANKIELVDCKSVEEYKTLAHEEIMLSSIYLAIDTTLLTEYQQKVASYFSNINGVIKKEFKVVAFKPDT